MPAGGECPRLLAPQGAILHWTRRNDIIKRHSRGPGKIVAVSDRRSAALEKETAALPRTEQAVVPAERLDAQLNLLRSLLARNASAQTRIAIAADPSA